MFLTRSIRRKLFTGFGCVFGMLILLSICGFVALYEHRVAISDLERSITGTPRRSDLVAGISVLFDPLLVRYESSSRGRVAQQAEFRARLQESRLQVAEFVKRLDDLPPSAGVQARRPITLALLRELQQRLDGLLGVELNGGNTSDLLREIAALHNLALTVPDPREGLFGSLRDNQRVYQWLFWIVVGCTSAVILLYVQLAWWARRLVVQPIRTLHEGAARVAQGDFSFRVQSRSGDEMGELAASFNKMTDRFLEVKEDLDHKVEERSRQLVRSERLAGVGFLSAGVAHEINSPLSAIVMASNSLQERVREVLPDTRHPEASVIMEYLDMIERESFRCREITDRLLNFARGQNSPRTSHDITALIQEVLGITRHLGKYRDRSILFERTAPCLAEVNGAEIKQVVLNLVANALVSMESEGVLQIGLQEQTDHVVLTFHDDGCGMTPDVIENLFEPFFTRSRSGRGTGLGLSITHRIVTDHGGSIEVESDGPGEGSRFRVVLPRRCTTDQQAA